MTVLIWDGKTLAADRMANAGSTWQPVTKIFKVNGCLVGITGDLSVGMELLEWFRQGAVPADYPQGNRDPDKGASLFVVRPDRTCWKYESSPWPFQHCTPAAAGSGTLGALVAVACGKTAVEAVLLVQQYDSSVGGGVTALEFD